MVTFSLYSRTVNCPSPYTVGLLTLLLDSKTGGLLPILLVFSLYCSPCGPYPYTVVCWCSPYTVGLFPTQYTVYFLAVSLDFSLYCWLILLAFCVVCVCVCVCVCVVCVCVVCVLCVVFVCVVCVVYCVCARAHVYVQWKPSHLLL